MGLIAVPFLLIALVFGLIATLIFISGMIITIITAVKSTNTRERKESLLCGMAVIFITGIIMLIGLFFYMIFDSMLY